MDGGKPIKESRDVDVPLAAAHFFYYAGWADKLEYAFPGRKVAPLGVCGQIIPWNFPLLMAAWKIAPALACGNTVVLKPAETTPLTALPLAKICQEADLPPGVVNIVPGAGETGAALVNHPASTRSRSRARPKSARSSSEPSPGPGRGSRSSSAGRRRTSSSRMPLDQAVEGIVNGIYFNQGHVCCAGSRLLVQESIAELLVRKLAMRIATLRLGDPLDKNTDIGAINSRCSSTRSASSSQCGVEEGARLHQSLLRAPGEGLLSRRRFFTDVAQSHRIAREEIFGPVLAVMTFRTPDEAIEKANNMPYGLSAGVWTDKGSKIFR